MAPAAGDELQGIKKGIVELADIILVNKADGDLTEAANHAAADYRNAVHMIRQTSPNWRVPVLTCSAVTGDGISKAWRKITDFHEKMTEFSVIIKGGNRDGELVYWTDNWQHPPIMSYDPPIKLNAGEGLELITTYDNPLNRTVTFGFLSTDEMMILFGWYYE